MTTRPPRYMSVLRLLSSGLFLAAAALSVSRGAVGLAAAQLAGALVVALSAHWSVRLDQWHDARIGRARAEERQAALLLAFVERQIAAGRAVVSGDVRPSRPN